MLEIRSMQVEVLYIQAIKVIFVFLLVCVDIRY